MDRRTRGRACHSSQHAPAMHSPGRNQGHGAWPPAASRSGVGVQRGDINVTSLCDVINMGKAELAGRRGLQARGDRQGWQGSSAGDKTGGEKAPTGAGTDGPTARCSLKPRGVASASVSPRQVLRTKGMESLSRVETQPVASRDRQGEALPDPVSPVPPTTGTAAPRCPTCPGLGARGRQLHSRGTRWWQGQGAVSPRPSVPAKGTFLLLPSPG